jgi:signal transduction histidine kinase
MRARLQQLHLFDVVVVALFVAAEVLAVAAPEDGSRVAQILLPAAWTLPLLARRRAPAPAVLAVMAALALESRLAQPATESLVVLLAVMLAFWVAGAIPDRGTALATGLVGLLLTFIVVADNPGPVRGADVLFVAIFTIAPFGAGLAAGTRERRALELEARTFELERDREQQAQAAIADERARIARELHDVVGHAISVMMVQAGAARLLVESDALRAREALLHVEDAGREALSEMRRMLEVLRAQDDGDQLDPQPGLAHIDDLVVRNREVGLDVSLSVEGRRADVSPGVDLAAYRIVQEALTNVRKHGSSGAATVVLRYEPDALDVVVENDGPKLEPVRAPGGHGIVGMRERVALYAGELTVGPRPEGGFAVHARLPLGEWAA